MNLGISNGGMKGGLIAVFMTTANNLVGGTLLTPSPPHININIIVLTPA